MLKKDETLHLITLGNDSKTQPYPTADFVRKLNFTSFLLNSKGALGKNGKTYSINSIREHTIVTDRGEEISKSEIECFSPYELYENALISDPDRFNDYITNKAELIKQFSGAIFTLKSSGKPVSMPDSEFFVKRYANAVATGDSKYIEQVVTEDAIKFADAIAKTVELNRVQIREFEREGKSLGGK